MVKLSRYLTMAVVLIAIAALFAAPAAARTSLNTIEPGDTVFVYETGLNVAALAPNGSGVLPTDLPTKFVKYSNDNPDHSISGGGVELSEIPCDSPGVLSVLSEPAYSNSIWYAWNINYNDPNTGHVNRSAYISIRDPDVSLDAVLATSHVDSVNGKSVTRSTPLSFKIVSTYVSSYYRVGSTAFGQVDVQVTTPGGGIVAVFGTPSVDMRNTNLTGTVLFTLPIYLSTVQAGQYTAKAVWTTAMPWYNQISNSNVVTFTVLSKALTITTNHDTIVTGNDFTVSLTGESNHAYYVYITGSSSSGYPKLLDGQVSVDTSTAAQDAIKAFVSDEAGVSGTLATVTTDASGTRTVEFSTDTVTDDQKFTVKVIDPADGSKYDAVDVQVQKGTVTLTMGGTGVFYMGEVITLTGTSSSGDTVYLFLTGPNLNSNGVRLDDATTHVLDGNAATFKAVTVDADNTWKYKWDTGALAATLDPGTYTVYAVDAPQGKGALSNHAYQTASIVIRKGLISIDTIPNTIANGDKLVISGIASGNPNNVYVWIFGKNYRSLYNPVSVKSDNTYSYKIDNIDLFDGQYYVIVQHPMANGPGVIGSDSNGNACSGNGCYGMIGNNASYNLGLVRLSGLQAPDATTALKDALDSSFTDDIYTWTTFMIATPFISIDHVPNHRIGDTLSIHGTTNIAVGDQILVTVTSLAFTPTTKSQSGGFSASSGSTAVYTSNGSSLNEFTISFDTTGYKPDEYSITAEGIVNNVVATSSFNMVEQTIPPTTIPTTVPPTTVPTTAPPTPPPTTVPTTVPTTEPTSSPGFGAMISVCGLVAVAYLVLRRE